MTGLIGFASGYYAMLDCDVLLMLGTDFPYRQFYPGLGVRIAQVDIGPSRSAAARRSISASSATSAPTLEALLPLLRRKRDRAHLDRRRRIIASARGASMIWPSASRASGRSTRSRSPRRSATRPPTTRSSPATSALPTVWAARYLAMNGKRRLIGSFWHGSMANAMAQAIGAQAAFPGRQVISLSGDGGFTMLMGDFLSLAQLETAGEGRGVQQRRARLHRARAEIDRLPRHRHGLQESEFRRHGGGRRHRGHPDRGPGEVEAGIAAALAHDGPVLVDAVVSRTELAMPPASRWRWPRASRSTW
jgi:pyruvate dehydrogenase (quinone)